MKDGKAVTKDLTDKKICWQPVRRGYGLYYIIYNRKVCRFFYLRMEEVDLKDLLHECSRNTGCDEKTVENVVTCFLNIIANRLSEGCTVDLGEKFGAFIIKERTGSVPENSPRTPKSIRYKFFFRESSKLRHRLKSPSFDNYAPSSGLLESLQVQVGCMYLSDLHVSSNLPLVQSALRKIEPDSYGLREWNDAVCYITGQELYFESQRDAAKYLMSWNR